eukprot:CAMPEP_0170989022 /NCGR_PEP_ID=MMETSP0736-20130129/7519_1 /TAXON_ID=186038 /ORGANISM="Fragilariopsis kerguelensis, Strain L26-C5" /LENGTH=435 /DNA_ID=CAMNT_0011413447 /DNA_START=141 /DNA_END=1448 /DNA_ORIENTATION=+
MKLAILLAITITSVTAFSPFHQHASKSTTVLSATAVDDPTKPVVKHSLFEESMPMLYASIMAYDFGQVIESARNGDITLKLPADFPKSANFCNKKFNNGNGANFAELMALIELNEEAFNKVLKEAYGGIIFDKEIINNIAKGNAALEKDLFLCVYRSHQAKTSCVYGIVKDAHNKRIIVAFRGSEPPSLTSNRDWQTNANAEVVKMEAPALVRGLQEHIYVHNGFHDYLFDNQKRIKIQIYDKIVEDIKPLMEDGYSVYVTGHSLGGSLAHLLSFTLAGKDIDWLPKPITCISYAAPYSGGSDYRTANEQLEKDDLLRSLRIFNENDFIPVFPPISLNFLPKPMKHTGINLRLTEENGYTIGHSSNDGFWNAVNNSFVKLFKKRLFEHGPQAHGDRLVDNKKELNAVTIDGLYKDKTVVSNDFIEGKTKSSNNKS